MNWIQIKTLLSRKKTINKVKEQSEKSWRIQTVIHAFHPSLWGLLPVQGIITDLNYEIILKETLKNDEKTKLFEKNNRNAHNLCASELLRVFRNTHYNFELPIYFQKTLG